MKYIYLVRHAKSSWEDYSLSDIERPLNKRGLRDAPFMGKLLNQQHISPDRIITSPAKRALSTAEIFMKEMDIPAEDIIIDNRIYGASPIEMINFITGIPDDFSNIMIFGHNPTFTTLANFLADAKIDNLPTCSVTGIEFSVNTWNETGKSKGKVIFFEYPKKYFSDK